MQIAAVQPGRFVKLGETLALFVHMSGEDALVELANGSRVMWSGQSDVAVVADVRVERRNLLPKLKDRLKKLEAFAEGKYAQLGQEVGTPCTPLPKELHGVFVTVALGPRPEGAVVCRRCRNKLCIRADHLFWGTRSDCQRDMCLKGNAKPSGKTVSAIHVARRIVRLRARVERMEAKL